MALCHTKDEGFVICMIHSVFIFLVEYMCPQTLASSINYSVWRRWTNIKEVVPEIFNDHLIVFLTLCYFLSAFVICVVTQILIPAHATLTQF